MGEPLLVPPQAWWPQGMVTDFVTVFPDRPRLWAPGPWPWQWPRTRRVDLRVPAWWHDCRYYLGYFVDRDIAWEDLAMQIPRPNAMRNEVQRRAIDEHMRIDFLEMGLSHWTAEAAAEVVRKFGKNSYYWLTPERWARMARPWERVVA